MGVRPLGANEYRLLVESSPVMIWRSALDAKCDYFNETWLAFTGRPIEEELGDGWATGVHPDDLARCVEHYLDHFRRRQAFEMEYRLRRHDGVYRWIFDRGVPFHDDDGAFAGFIGSCVDVDERRQAQEARERRDEEQLAVARNFEQWILGIVGHDIRNPLGAIDLAARHLLLAANDTDAVKKDAERVTRGVLRIKHIVNDLLDLSRERGGGIPISPGDADLAAICRQVIDELEARAKDRAISLECAGDTTGRWDAQRLLQAVSNLVGNALQHGQPRTPVRVTAVGQPDHVLVEVHNAGEIPGELLPAIFDPFRCGGAAADRPRTEGLGLGLFITKAIVRAHRGNVLVESSPSGPTFRVMLPRVPVELATTAGER
jgi:PAS domain S-box-containing protein